MNALLTSEIPHAADAAETDSGNAGGGPPPSSVPAAANLPSMDELTPEIIRLNSLRSKTAAALALARATSVAQKMYKDQVKSRGGSMPSNSASKMQEPVLPEQSRKSNRLR